MLVEQDDEWLVSRRYLSQESIAAVLADRGTAPDADGERKEVAELSVG